VATIHIAAVLEDAEDAVMAAHVLMAAGWKVERLIFAGDAAEAEACATAAKSDCLFVLWSSLATQRERLRWAAEKAHRRKALVTGRLDHAVHPIPDAPSIDLTKWQQQSDAAVGMAIAATVGKIAGPPEFRPGEQLGSLKDATDPRATRAAARRTVRNRRLALGLLATALFLMLGVGVAQFLEPNREIIPLSAFSWPGDVVMDQAHRSSDPVALRAALKANPEGPEAKRAAQRLADLETQAWARIENAEDSASLLDATAAYIAGFPDGGHAEQARRRDATERQFILEVQQRLVGLGLLREAPSGRLTPETLAAVSVFQISRNLPPTRQLDARLANAIVAAGGAPFRTNSTTAAATRSPAAARAGQVGLAQGVQKPVRDCFLCPELLVLPPGAVMMATGAGAQSRLITINYSLAVGRNEVSTEEWAACVDAGVCRAVTTAGPGETAIVNVSFDEAQAYTRWLSKRTGQAYRLLSDAEWEYAAQSGFGGPLSAANMADICVRANLAFSADDPCAMPTRAPRLSLTTARPDQLGFSNFYGNAWEWVADCWPDSAPTALGDGTPRLTGCKQGQRTIRGGGLDSTPADLLASTRRPAANERSALVGFRVARVVSPKTK
jgi:formylglycine-generating enzyme required for sulfatase activity